MANTIKLKRSAVQNKTPTTTDLDLGELAINTYDGKLYLKKDNGTPSIVEVGAGGSGTVTSVAQSFTGGIVSVSGSPVTTSGTLALTVAGTSGGIPYFSSGTTWTSSGALAANALVIGGGAGAAPATTTTGTGVLTALGVNTGTAGAFVVNGGALGTPSSGTVTNLTGTASININGTVGATTPTTGAFTTVSASGVATFSAGSASAPAITTSGDTNNGIFFPATDVTAITTAGSERLRVDASGNVGIGGSTSPDSNSYKVLITQPSLGFNLNDTRLFLRLQTTTSNDDYLDFYKIRFSSGGIDWRTSGWRIQNKIDTTSMSYIQFVLPKDGGVEDRGIAFGTGDGGTERMRIDGSGNVGIGTTSPTNILSLGGNSARTFWMERHKTSNTAGNNLTVQAGGATSGATDKNGGNLVLSSGTSTGTGTSQIIFNTAAAGTTGTTDRAPAERMRINSAGELLIGTTTDNGAYLLQVNSQIFATNATIATSDGRLKENVAPITNALDTIGKVQAVAFDFKQDTEYNFDTARQTGFIAQDLQVALADKDYKDSIVKECGPYLGVAYEKMVPVLVAAIQEQQQQIDALKAEVAALKGNA